MAVATQRRKEAEIIELSCFNQVEEIRCGTCWKVLSSLPCSHIVCQDCYANESLVNVPFQCPLCNLSDSEPPPKDIPCSVPDHTPDKVGENHQIPPRTKRWTEVRSFGGTGSNKGNFRGPRDLAVSESGEIFVADYRNERIQVFDSQGTFRREFLTLLPDEEEIYPYSVSLDSGENVWVVGRASNRRSKSHMPSTFALLEYCGVVTNSSQYDRQLAAAASSRDFALQYTKQGRYLMDFDVERTKWATRGIAIDTEENHVIVTKVTEEGGSVVQVFRADGELMRTVGDQEGMEYPHYVCVDGEGRVIVSDSAGPYVYVYNRGGEFLFKFGGWGEGTGQLNRPHGICTDTVGNIIVADSGNDRVEMFNNRGEFLEHLITDIKQPLAVAMTRRRQLIVSNSDNVVAIFHKY